MEYKNPKFACNLSFETLIVRKFQKEFTCHKINYNFGVENYFKENNKLNLVYLKYRAIHNKRVKDTNCFFYNG